MGYERLAMRIRRLLGGNTDITERKMFGELAFLHQNRMSCGIVHRDLVVRVTDDEFEAVVHMKDVRPMDFTGRPLKNFVYVLPPGFPTAIAYYGQQAPPSAGKAWPVEGGPSLQTVIYPPRTH